MTRQIPPNSLDSCVGFYELLGFERAPQPPSLAERAVWLELGATQLHLMPMPDAEPERGHIAIVVPDYDGLRKTLAEAGHEVEPRREHWGSPRAYVRDPAGNIVELIAFAP